MKDRCENIRRYIQNNISSTKIVGPLEESVAIRTKYIFIFDIQNSHYITSATGKAIPSKYFTSSSPLIPYAAWYENIVLEKGCTYKLLNCSDLSLFKDIHKEKTCFDTDTNITKNSIPFFYENGKIFFRENN